MSSSRNVRGFTLIELLVVVAIIALLPSLTKAKSLAKAIVCANRHKAAYIGWSFYANDFNSVWMATWDRTAYTWAGPYTLQIPVTMWYYVLGESLPGPAYKNGQWYNIASKSYGGFSMYTTPIGPEDNPNYHCPVMVDKGEQANPIWYFHTSMSVFAPELVNSGGNWQYDSNYYPKPDLFTHPGSSGLLMCLSGIRTENMQNAWCHYEGYPANPHDGKSNTAFSDGHVEKLGTDETDITMWRPMLQRGGQ